MTDANAAPVTLLEACKKGDLKVVQSLLLEAGNDDAIHQADSDGWSPLMQASSAGCVPIVEILLDHGANVNQRNSWGMTTLLVAGRYGHLGVVRLLLKRGALVNGGNDYGCTPLLRAANDGHLPMVEALLQHGANANQVDHRGIAPLFNASQSGHLQVAKCLLEHGADVNRSSNDRETPLWLACRQGHLEVVRFLLSRGAHVDPATLGGETPLLWAAQHGRLELLLTLLEYGADTNRADNSGRTPLVVAVTCRRWNVLMPLLEKTNGLERAFQLLVATPRSVLGWLDTGDRTILSLKGLSSNFEHGRVRCTWDAIVAFLWYSESSRSHRRPPVLADTAGQSDEIFKNKYKWMIHSVSSMLYGDIRLLQHLCRVYDKTDVALEVCEHTGKTPLWAALSLFPRWNSNIHTWKGLECLVEWNPQALQQRDAITHRIPLACALENSVPMDIIWKMIQLWPAAIEEQDPKSGLDVYLLVATQYSVSEIYSLLRHVLPDKLAGMVPWLSAESLQTETNNGQ